MSGGLNLRFVITYRAEAHPTARTVPGGGAQSAHRARPHATIFADRASKYRCFAHVDQVGAVGLDFHTGVHAYRAKAPRTVRAMGRTVRAVPYRPEYLNF